MMLVSADALPGEIENRRRQGAARGVGSIADHSLLSMRRDLAINLLLTVFAERTTGQPQQASQDYRRIKR
jgi:hypothetical protein